MRTYQILFAAILGLAVLAGCDPGLAADASVSSLVQPSMGTGGDPQEGCDQVTDAPGTVWTAIPVANQPGLVLMERNGTPICFDTVASLAAHAAKLNVRLVVQLAAPTNQPAPVGVGNSGPSLASKVTDDPIPVGGTRVAENVSSK